MTEKINKLIEKTVNKWGESDILKQRLNLLITDSINKWTELGFLDNINDDVTKRNMTIAFDICANKVIGTEHDKIKDDIFPVIHRIFKSVDKEMEILYIGYNVTDIIKDFSPKWFNFLETTVDTSALPTAEFVAEYCENYELKFF